MSKLGIFVFILFLLIYIYSFFRKKDSLKILLTYLALAPLIRINDLKLNPTYFIILLLFAIIIIYKKKIIIPRKISSYLKMLLVLFTICFFSTLIHFTLFNGALNPIIGFIKVPILIILIYSVYGEKYDYNSSIKGFVKLSLLLNLFACLIQFIYKDDCLELFKTLYSNGSDYYSSANDKFTYTRLFGLFQTPVYLGNFCLFILAYLLIVENNKYQKLIYITICLILGFMSATKSFVLGSAVCLIVSCLFYIFDTFKQRKIKKNKIMILILFIFIIPFLFILFNILINILAKNGIFIKYYLSFLSNPFSALETRYNTANDLVLSNTYEIIKNNLLLGVGFGQMENEFLGDSTYILALHNGGIIALSVIVVFYLKQIINSFHQKQIIFVLIWILTGFALPTLYNYEFVIPFIFIYFMNINSKEVKYEKNSNV